MTTPTERKARNERAFRDANDELERGARDVVATSDSLVPFLCECPKQDCFQVVLLTLAEYARAHAGPALAVVAAGHEDCAIERVVARNDRFVTVEKIEEAAAAYAAAGRPPPGPGGTPGTRRESARS